MASNGQEKAALSPIQAGALEQAVAAAVPGIVEFPEDFTTLEALRDYARRLRLQGEHAYQVGVYLRDMANRAADGIEKAGTSFNAEFLSVARRELLNAEKFIGRKVDGQAPKG